MEESLAATSAPGALARLAETLADIPRVHLRDTEPFTGPGPVAIAEVREAIRLNPEEQAYRTQLDALLKSQKDSTMPSP